MTNMIVRGLLTDLVMIYLITLSGKINNDFIISDCKSLSMIILNSIGIKKVSHLFDTSYSIF